MGSTGVSHSESEFSQPPAHVLGIQCQLMIRTSCGRNECSTQDRAQPDGASRGSLTLIFISHTGARPSFPTTQQEGTVVLILQVGTLRQTCRLAAPTPLFLATVDMEAKVKMGWRESSSSRQEHQ